MNKRTNNRKVKRIIIVAVFAIALSVITAFVLVPLVNNKDVEADKKPDEPTTEYLSDDGWTEYIYAKKVHCDECGKWYDYDEALSNYRDNDHCNASYSIQDVLVDAIWHEGE